VELGGLKGASETKENEVLESRVEIVVEGEDEEEGEEAQGNSRGCDETEGEDEEEVNKWDGGGGMSGMSLSRRD
jgi:hypothetical protein